MTTRRLGVSNLAWPAEAHEAALAVLASHGAQGVEVAPTRIAPWETLGEGQLRAFRAACAQAGLVVSSLQAIFYLKPEAALLGDEAAFGVMAEHVRRIAGIASLLGAGVAVFGAPKNRLRGPLAAADAMRLGAERLRILGDLAAEGDLILGMEPVPPVYGADFLTRAREIVEIVRMAGHPRVRAHLDTSCVALAGDDVAEAIHEAAPWLAHYHIAEPQLGPFEAPVGAHARAGAALEAVGYAGWVVIEMREQESLAAVATAVAFGARTYLQGRQCAESRQ